MKNSLCALVVVIIFVVSINSYKTNLSKSDFKFYQSKISNLVKQLQEKHPKLKKNFRPSEYVINLEDRTEDKKEYTVVLNFKVLNGILNKKHKGPACTGKIVKHDPHWDTLDQIYYTATLNCFGDRYDVSDMDS